MNFIFIYAILKNHIYWIYSIYKKNNNSNNYKKNMYLYKYI